MFHPIQLFSTAVVLCAGSYSGISFSNDSAWISTDVMVEQDQAVEGAQHMALGKVYT